MATLAFRMIGSTLGSALGGPLGGTLGSMLGAYAGAQIDRALLGGGKVVEGPRLDNTVGISAQEGAPVPRCWGRVRLGGQVIWATEFEEERLVERQGGAGGKGLGKPNQPGTARYRYFAHVAIGLCEGPLLQIRRIWADDRELDLTTITLRLYTGSETQMPDPLIVAKQGTGNIPAFRGLAYVVFERFPLEDYGNRLPQFRFEVIGPGNELGPRLKAINLIPGSSEFAYAPEERREDFGYGETRPLNRHQLQAASDWEASLDNLQALAPALERVTLIAGWYGDDLRAGQCKFQPRSERPVKAVLGAPWQVAGLTRETAFPVSAPDGRPAYGGSPADASLVAAIRDLKARGLKVTLHPFVLMDIAPGNTLPHPATGQQPYPWRGRIVPGGPDVAGEMAALLGQAQPGQFSLAGDAVVYAGPEDWGYRRMVLHHAMLAKAAGGVDAFILGSEFVGLSHASTANGQFPFVAGLMALAAEVRALLGPATRLTYAADWTEYGARMRQGGAEIRFPLDPLWAHPAIDAVAIDAYPPLSDWRPEPGHADAQLASGPADRAYLATRITAGEAFDWYYPDDAARLAGQRLPITDGAYGKPWLYRAKDMASWWLNPHIERTGGVEHAAPTAWQPGSKPVWLAEIGCAAVQFGANAPNLFPDPKSAENGLPPFSRGGRDDLVQLRLNEAWHDRYGNGAGPGNPLSPLTGQPMVPADAIAPWAWDARPFPVFPLRRSQWSDGANWPCGHWLNGRLEAVPLDALIRALFRRYGLEEPLCEGVDGMVDGYLIDRPMPLRGALEPLARLFGLAFHARAGRIVVRGRPHGPVAAITADELVPAEGDGRRMLVQRQPDADLPRRLTLGFVDSEAEFTAATVVASHETGLARREATEPTALHLPRGLARRLAEQTLQDVWARRETWHFRLAPARLALEPGDVVAMPDGALVRLSRITDGPWREVVAERFEPALADLPAGDDALPPEPDAAFTAGPPHARLVEWPVARPEGLLALAVRAEPWQGPYAVVDTASGQAEPVAEISAPARLGRTISALPAGPLWRWDHHARFDVQIAGGALASLGAKAVLANGNLLAMTGPDGLTEILGFREAVLVGEGRFRLSGLLRGLGGSEPAAGRTLPPGAPVLVLDEAVATLPVGPERLNQPGQWRLVPAGRDLADPAGVALAHIPLGLGLTPLAPVHPRAGRVSGGILITFRRRTRAGGDSWDLFEVPLGEDQPAFRLEVMAGEVVRRSVALAETEWLYPAAAELADFGTAQTTLDLRIAQISHATGPGHACRRLVTVW